MKKYLLLIIILIPGILFSEEQSGTISGKVTDEATLQPVPGANIVVEGSSAGAATDENGNYKITGLAFGNYRLRVSAIGYKSLVKSDIIVNSARPAIVDFMLQEAVIELEGVTITSDYFQKDAHETNSVTNLSYEEMRRAPGGFEDVVRALSVLPGVAQADAGRNDLVVRGGAPSENLYIVDGIVVPNINHFGSQGATGGPLSFINLDFIKDATFSTGGFSALYGDKLSSVLNINLKEGRKDRLGGKATISATQFGLNAEGPLSKNLDFLFSARRSYLDLIFKAAGFGFVPEYYDLFSKLNYNMDNSNSLSFLFIGAFDNVRYFNDTPDKRFKNSTILGSNQNIYVTGLSYRHLYNKGYFTFSANRNYSDFDTSQRDSLLVPIFLNKSREGENNFTADLIYKPDNRSEINLGSSLKLIKSSSEIKLPLFRTSFGDTLMITSLSARNNYSKVAFYGQYSNFVMERLKVNIGFRGDYFNAVETKFYLSPRFSMSYQAGELTSLNFSTGIYYQTPSYIWLAAEETNKNLKSIRADNYILGVEQRLQEDMLFKVEGFFKNYKNYPASVLRPYLVLANTGAGYSGSEDNFSSFGLEPLVSGGTGQARGFEVLLQKKSGRQPLYGLFSITYSEANFKALDGVSRPGSYDQRWIINLSSGYIFNESWEASMKFRVSTGKPYTPFNSDGSQNIQDYNSERMGINHSLDLRVDKRWNFNTWALITYIDVQNVYNRKNTTYMRWDARKKEVDQSSSIGLLPSIGISAEI